MKDLFISFLGLSLNDSCTRKDLKAPIQKPNRFEPLSVMDQMCEMIMKEARTRKGNNLVLKIITVLLEINAMVFKAVRIFKENERKEKNDENQ